MHSKWIKQKINKTRNRKQQLPPVAAEPTGWPHVPNFKFWGGTDRQKGWGRGME